MPFKESKDLIPEKETRFRTVTEPFKEGDFKGTLEKKFDVGDGGLQEIIIKNSKGEIVIYENVPACKTLELESKLRKLLLEQENKEQ